MIYLREQASYCQEEEKKSLLFLYHCALGRCFLKVLTAPWISKVAGWYLSSSLSKGRIRRFIRQNDIDMTQYEEENYTSFNDFFIRKIKDQERVLPKKEEQFISPADSRVLVLPIDENSTFCIKNGEYTLTELLKDASLAQQYAGGYCFIYRLCVDDYHRYSYIDDGRTLSHQHIPGILHTVQPIAFHKNKVFLENTREYDVLKTKNFGTIVQMEVGALLVGKICNRKQRSFHRGEEKGHFCFGGSTVVVLVEKDKVIPHPDLLENSARGIESRIYLYEVVGKKYDV